MKFCNVKHSAAADHTRFLVLRGTLAVGLLALLGACGGGGGGGSTAPVTVAPVVPPVVVPVTPGVQTYSLLAGFRALIQAGSVDNFTVAGDCTGTAQTSNGAATPTTFEGVAAFSTAESATLSLPSCSSTPTSSTGVNYYDANFALIGTSNISGGYSVAAAGALALPASVKVGDANASYNIYVLYTDSTKTVPAGRIVEGYAIEADSASTTAAPSAIYHVTSKAFDNAGGLLSTQQSFYRLGSTGTLQLLSLDVLYSGTLIASHLVYTRVN